MRHRSQHDPPACPQLRWLVGNESAFVAEHITIQAGLVFTTKFADTGDNVYEGEVRGQAEECNGKHASKCFFDCGGDTVELAEEEIRVAIQEEGEAAVGGGVGNSKSD